MRITRSRWSLGRQPQRGRRPCAWRYVRFSLIADLKLSAKNQFTGFNEI